MSEKPAGDCRRESAPECAENRPGLPPVGSEQGQAIVEFAIAFPLQLMIMLFIMQLALIYVGKQVVTYAAYQAGRSAAVSIEHSHEEALIRAHRAAAMICSPITGATIRGGAVSRADVQLASMELPGWGELPQSGISSRIKTHIAYLEFIPPNEVEITVTHYYELTLPVIGYLLRTFLGDPAPEMRHGIGRDATMSENTEMAHEDAVGIWDITAPHMRLRSTARVALPRIVE